MRCRRCLCSVSAPWRRRRGYRTRQTAECQFQRRKIKNVEAVERHVAIEQPGHCAAGCVVVDIAKAAAATAFRNRQHIARIKSLHRRRGRVVKGLRQVGVACCVGGVDDDGEVIGRAAASAVVVTVRPATSPVSKVSPLPKPLRSTTLACAAPAIAMAPAAPSRRCLIGLSPVISAKTRNAGH